MSDVLMIPETPGTKGVSQLLGHIIRVYQLDYHLVGEERMIGHVFLCGISRHLPRKYRRHYLSTGEFGSGKSTIIKTTLRPFSVDVESYSRLTGPGLDRRTETFDGKILLIEQILQREPMELSFLMSEGELSVLSAERDEKTGKIVSKKTTLKGEPVVISTITGADAGPQYISRTSTGRIDESEEQTRRIIGSKLGQWKRVDRSDPARQGGVVTWIDGKCRELGLSVKAIQAPWADQLEKSIPPVLSMRRGLDKLTSLVNVICFVKSACGLRPRVQVQLATGVFESYLVAEPEDLQDAMYILGEEELLESVTYFFARTKEVYSFLLGHDGATSKDVAVGLKLSQNRASEYLRSLKDFGHATRTKVGAEYHYTGVENILPELRLGPEFIQQLRSGYTTEALRAWFQENFPGTNAKLLLPGTDIASAVVSVPMPPKLTFDTMEPIVSESGTVAPIVPIPWSDGYDTDTAADAVEQTLQASGNSQTKPNLRPDNGAGGVGVTAIQNNEPETSNIEFADRVDVDLVEDFLLATAIPREEALISYATTERLTYHVVERFREPARAYVPEVLKKLSEKGLITQSPFPRCWRLVK